ncbi:response regulator [Marinomonas ostreistagni]|uniref:response regulator n=1 Tax=Marinomonas ostreistagni TaxID=359209 RepID=UPI00194F154C|nr:response regulator [Marinomonas ostreistagni]MBM6550556.1 response regulator [Marinomonas ostreistagni]
MSEEQADTPILLMLDDDQEDALLVSTALRRAQLPLSFTHIQTSEQFGAYLGQIEAWLAQRPVALLLDLNMPGKSGLDWLARLRQQSELKCLRIIVFSTSCASEERLRTLALGADEHIGKPDSVAELVTVLSAVYERWISSKEW